MIKINVYATIPRYVDAIQARTWDFWANMPVKILGVIIDWNAAKKTTRELKFKILSPTKPTCWPVPTVQLEEKTDRHNPDPDFSRLFQIVPEGSWTTMDECLHLDSWNIHRHKMFEMKFCLHHVLFRPRFPGFKLEWFTLNSSFHPLRQVKYRMSHSQRRIPFPWTCRKWFVPCFIHNSRRMRKGQNRADTKLTYRGCY